MKKLIYLITIIIAQVLYAQDIGIIDDNCECLENISVDQALELKDRSIYSSGDLSKWKSCISTVNWHLTDLEQPCVKCSEIGIQEVIFNQTQKSLSSENSCSKEERKEFLELYTAREQVYDDVLEKVVSQNVCGASFCDQKKNKVSIDITSSGVEKLKYCSDKDSKSSSKAKACTRKIREIFIDNKDSIFAGCGEDSRGEARDKKLENRCLKRNTYREILFRGGLADVEKTFCEEKKGIKLDSEKNISDCFSLLRENIYRKLIDIEILSKTEFDICNDRRLDTEKARHTCEAVIIGTLFGFNTKSDKLKLFMCVDNAYTNEQVKACYNSLVFKPEDMAHLDYIRSRFCSQYSEGAEQDKCVQSILARYMDEFSPPEKCLKISDEVKKQACIRDAFLNFIKSQDHLSLEDCWDLDKYPSSKQRVQCVKKNKEFLEKIRSCVPDENPPITSQELSCLLKLKDQDLVRLYMDKLAANLNPAQYEICKSLPSSEEQQNCIMNLLEGKELNSSNKEFCYVNSMSSICSSEYSEKIGAANIPVSNGEDGSMQSLEPVGDMGDHLNDTYRNGVDYSSAGGVAAAIAAAGGGASLATSESANGADYSGINIKKDKRKALKGMEIRDILIFKNATKTSIHPTCQRAHKAAKSYIKCFSGNRIFNIFKNIRVTDWLKNQEESKSNDIQNSSQDAMKQIYSNSELSAKVDKVCSGKAEQEFSAALIELEQEHAQSGDVDCRKMPTAVVQLDPVINENEYLLYSQSKMKNARSTDEVFKIFLETQAYLSESTYYNDIDITIPNDEINYFEAEDKDFMVKILSGILSNSAEIFLPSALAADEQKNESTDQVMQIAKQAMPLLLTFATSKLSESANEQIQAQPIESVKKVQEDTQELGVKAGEEESQAVEKQKVFQANIQK